MHEHHPTFIETVISVIFALLGGLYVELTNPESYLMKLVIMPAIAASIGYWSIRIWKSFFPEKK